MKVKSIAIKVWKIFMNCIYKFIKLLEIENKITFISRQTNNKNIDFDLLIDKITEEYPSYKIVVLNKKLEKGLSKKIAYFFHMFKQMYHIATSKTVVLDSYCIVVSILRHKKETSFIQLWHALGSLKKFGYSILDREEGRSSKIAKLMDMHKNYTYILTSSQLSKKYFMEAFNAKEEQMVVLGLPRIDFLRSQYCREMTRDKFFEKYPKMNNNKKNILYVPTKREKRKIDLDKIISSVNYAKYNLIIKLHNGKGLLYVNKKIIYNETSFLGIELLHIADFVITDYSAIVYEAAIIKKPIYFYAFDYEDYIYNRGFYIDYRTEMPGPISKDINEILNLIEDNVVYEDKLNDFIEKYCIINEEPVTGKIVNFIVNKKELINI